MPDNINHPPGLEEVEPEAWPDTDCPHNVPEDIVSVEEPITGETTVVCISCGQAVDPSDV